MFWKLTALIFGLGCIACVLLLLRQARMEAVYELGKTHERIAEHDRTLWRLRTEIASRTTPDGVRSAIEQAGFFREGDADVDGATGQTPGGSASTADDAARRAADDDTTPPNPPAEAPDQHNIRRDGRSAAR